MLSSSAEACSSKLNWRQKRLRSARPQARLMREPKVEWITRWVSPTSSKKRSNTTVSSVGSVPSAAWPAARYWASCWAATASSCFSSRSQVSRASGPSGQVRERVLAQARHRGGQLVAARRRLAEPERHRRRHAPGVLHEHLVGLDLLHAVRGVAELEDVAGHALEGEVLVDRADAEALRLQHHVVVELVRDHAGIGHRGQLARRGARAARRLTAS